ncbi:hypothetical protein Leryth_002200 [Lithospermum erythrorhizon]|nr:hypothetical protein Leryth_002200 [Lithospermum erythrorhizon]
MDLWVVAAAAGAGYIAKNWQNSSIGDKESSDEMFLRNSIHGQSNSSNFLDQIREKTCPVRLLSRRRRKREAFLQQVADVLERNGGRDVSETMASTSHSQFSQNGGMDEYGVNWFERERLTQSTESVNADCSNCGICSGDVGVDEYNVHWSERGNISGSKEFVVVDRNSTAYRLKKDARLMNRRRHEYFIRPLDTSESCIAAQICRECEEEEEDAYSSTPLKPTTMLRPLLVTDGSRVISRASIDSSVVRINGEIDETSDTCLEKNTASQRDLIAYNNNGDVNGLHRKSKAFPGGEQTRRSNNKVSKGPFDSSGPSNEMIMFFMGMTIGILSVMMGNKRELDKLSIQLKQTENLVEDLHEELEMKNKLSVRELVDEASHPPETMDDFYHLNRESNALSPPPNDRMAESPDLKNDIEAELLAELERLELDLKTSSYATLNEDIQALMVEGEIPNVHTGKTEGESETDNEEITDGNNYHETGNYAVSPRELSLRLHEVIEARLEARIKELETTIQNSERRLHLHESQRRFTYSEAECSCTPQSPVYMCHGSDEDDPLVINLAGNALDAYNEAYAEMLRTTGSENEPDSPLCQRKTFESTSSAHVPEDFSGTSSLIKIRSYEDLTSRSLRSSERGDGEEEDDDHELDMLLIKRIVEKKRSGANLLVYGS